MPVKFAVYAFPLDVTVPMVAIVPWIGTALSLPPPVTSISFAFLTLKTDALALRTSRGLLSVSIPFKLNVPTVSKVFAVLSVILS